jgi:hypothetical protein
MGLPYQHYVGAEFEGHHIGLESSRGRWVLRIALVSRENGELFCRASCYFVNVHLIMTVRFDRPWRSSQSIVATAKGVSLIVFIRHNRTIGCLIRRDTIVQKCKREK